MTFADTLKSLRKQAGLSQEALAEKVGVSRQAITKWEGGTGIPDMDNVLALSSLFGVSLDTLFAQAKGAAPVTDFLYESSTEYDIDEPKRYDLKLGSASRLVLTGHDGEKLRVRLASNTLATLQSSLKVKIDDVKKRIDVEVLRKEGLAAATAKEAVTVFVQLPNRYLALIELDAAAETVELSGLDCESIELDIKAHKLLLDGVVGAVEVDCNQDMEVLCRTLSGSLALNQLSSTSKLWLPEGTPFYAVAKGLGTGLFYEKDGRPCEPFGVSSAEECDNYIELNGMKSELTLCQELGKTSL